MNSIFAGAWYRVDTTARTIAGIGGGPNGA